MEVRGDGKMNKTKFVIEVFTDHRRGWQRLKPSKGSPYIFDTEHEARQMANTCYPNHNSVIRVKEVDI